MATQSAEAIQKLLEMTALRDRDLDQQVFEDWCEVDKTRMATHPPARPPARPQNYQKRGEIHFAALDPTVGAEIKKTRPVVVVQNNRDQPVRGTYYD